MKKARNAHSRIACTRNSKLKRRMISQIATFHATCGPAGMAVLMFSAAASVMLILPNAQWLLVPQCSSSGSLTFDV